MNYDYELFVSSLLFTSILFTSSLHPLYILPVFSLDTLYVLHLYPQCVYILFRLSVCFVPLFFWGKGGVFLRQKGGTMGVCFAVPLSEWGQGESKEQASADTVRFVLYQNKERRHGLFSLYGYVIIRCSN